MTEINTANVFHRMGAYGANGEYPHIQVTIYDGEDVPHIVVIDRASSARALIAAAQDYLDRVDS